VQPLNADVRLGDRKGGVRLGDLVSVKSVETQSDPTEDIVMILTGKRRSSLTTAEWDMIQYKVKGEEWRRANIVYKIYKWDGENYHEITLDQYIEEQISGIFPKRGKR
jgi:hypothetical protein